MAFRVGQKVVCVDAKEEPGHLPFGPTECLTVGQVYTVARNVSGFSLPSIHLVEIARDEESVAQHGPHVGYGAYRFRPIVARKTDISIFTKILTDQKAGADA